MRQAFDEDLLTGEGIGRAVCPDGGAGFRAAPAGPSSADRRGSPRLTGGAVLG
ncbi:hypothetical protein TEK04_19800 [Klenkia sp. LSe6-5]|uniref:Uncharacterized protein n=1 Tax=Klenkia sesuvii TaxID=3103137 RepID=A0ABU8DYS0_9ACTN